MQHQRIIDFPLQSFPWSHPLILHSRESHHPTQLVDPLRTADSPYVPSVLHKLFRRVSAKHCARWQVWAPLTPPQPAVDIPAVELYWEQSQLPVRISTHSKSFLGLNFEGGHDPRWQFLGTIGNKLLKTFREGPNSPFQEPSKHVDKNHAELDSKHHQDVSDATIVPAYHQSTLMDRRQDRPSQFDFAY